MLRFSYAFNRPKHCISGSNNLIVVNRYLR
jgi:hypothetical protein